VDNLAIPDVPFTLVHVKSVRSGTPPVHVIMPLNAP
jgi:hypothetical protein